MKRLASLMAKEGHELSVLLVVLEHREGEDPVKVVEEISESAKSHYSNQLLDLWGDHETYPLKYKPGEYEEKRSDLNNKSEVAGSIKVIGQSEVELSY